MEAVRNSGAAPKAFNSPENPQSWDHPSDTVKDDNDEIHGISQPSAGVIGVWEGRHGSGVGTEPGPDMSKLITRSYPGLSTLSKEYNVGTTDPVGVDMFAEGEPFLHRTRRSMMHCFRKNR